MVTMFPSESNNLQLLSIADIPGAIIDETVDDQDAIKNKRVNIDVEPLAIETVDERKRPTGRDVLKATEFSTEVEVIEEDEPETIRKRSQASIAKLSIDNEEEDETKKKRRQKRLKMLKKFGKHAGLFSLLMAYTTIGGGIFLSMEKEADFVLQLESQTKLNSTFHFWCQIANNSNQNDCVKFLLDELTNNATFMLPRELRSDTMRWNYMNAAFYSSAIYSTIGYGMIVTRTTVGKLTTIVYATIGIPLYLIVMSDMGGFLKSCIQILIAVIKKLFRQNFAKTEKSDNWSRVINFDDYDFVPLPIWFAVLLLYLYVLFSAFIYLQFERDWNYMTGFWFSFITFATIGFGDEFPKNPNYIHFSFVLLLVGMSIMSMCLDTIKDTMQQKYADAEAKQKSAKKYTKRWLKRIQKKSNTS